MRDLDHSRTGGGSMKRQAVRLVSLLSLLLVAGSAIAQSIHVRGDIPFNFVVGSKTYPAGTYEIGTIDVRNSRTLLLKARDGNASAMINSNAAESLTPANKTKLVFNRYGNQYFLSRVWVNGETLGHQLPKSSREKEMARDMIRNLTQERVEVLASLQ
jgi:hypothetical protein